MEAQQQRPRTPIDLSPRGQTRDCLGHHAPREEANVATAHYSCTCCEEIRDSRHGIGCSDLAVSECPSPGYGLYQALFVSSSHHAQPQPLFSVIKRSIRLCFWLPASSSLQSDLTPPSDAHENSDRHRGRCITTESRVAGSLRRQHNRSNTIRPAERAVSSKLVGCSWGGLGNLGSCRSAPTFIAL